MNSKEYFSNGQLRQAIKSLDDEVKAHPTDIKRRGFLIELLCISGELERADKQLDIITQQDSKAVISIALIRQLIRAQNIRQQCFYEGRLPEFINNTPSRDMQLHLEALTYLRDNKPEQANRLLQQVASEQPRLNGRCNDQAFNELRDLDDSCLSFLEVLTSNGKYYWISLTDIKSVEFQSPKNPIDLFWRQAKIEVKNGPEGVVYIPAIYCTPEQTDQQLMGRETDWYSDTGGPTFGKGQRMFLMDENEYSIMEIKSLIIEESLN